MKYSSATIGKYKIEEEIGEGSYAKVFRAIDTVLGREVALKVFHESRLRDRNDVQRFYQEAKLYALLSHPNIISIYDVVLDSARLYIPMPLIRGGDLRSLIKREGRVGWNDFLSIMQGICSALDYAHSKNIIHRDLKPANILLTDDQTPVLTDFGIAKHLSNNNSSTTHSNGFIGTPSYVAPELWEGDKLSHYSDIYSLACITYEMLTGKVLFGGNHPLQIINAHGKGPIFKFSLNSPRSKELNVILRAALSRNPAMRYTSATAFLNAIKEVVFSTDKELKEKQISLSAVFCDNCGLFMKPQEIKCKACGFPRKTMTQIDQEIYRCNSCNTNVSVSDTFCEGCGNFLLHCGKCGSRNRIGYRYCGKCGGKR